MTYYEIKRFPPSKRNFPSKQACYANRHVISSAFFGWFSGKTTERRDVKFGIHVYGGNVWGNVDAFSEKIISFKVMGHYVTNCKIVRDIWSFLDIFNGFWQSIQNIKKMIYITPDNIVIYMCAKFYISTFSSLSRKPPEKFKLG